MVWYKACKYLYSRITNHLSPEKKATMSNDFIA